MKSFLTFCRGIAPYALPNGHICVVSPLYILSFPLRSQCSGDVVCAQILPCSNSSSAPLVEKNIRSHYNYLKRKQSYTSTKIRGLSNLFHIFLIISQIEIDVGINTPELNSGTIIGPECNHKKILINIIHLNLQT